MAIDPGPERSAWLLLEGSGVRGFGITPNLALVAKLRARSPSGRLWEAGDADVLVIENIEPRYGLSTGWETLDTARWVGRFEEAAQSLTVELLKRSSILRHLGIASRGNADQGVRMALIDRYGGKAVAIGTVKAKGPLHGIATHCWSALAVAVSYAEGLR